MGRLAVGWMLLESLDRYSQAAAWRKLEAHADLERKPLETPRLGSPARIPGFGNQSQKPPKALEIRDDK